MMFALMIYDWNDSVYPNEYTNDVLEAACNMLPWYKWVYVVETSMGW